MLHWPQSCHGFLGCLKKVTITMQQKGLSLITLLVGGRASIPALALEFSSLRSSKVSAVVFDLTPAQTRTRYFSASAVSWSDKVSTSPKFVKYCTGSEAIAACFVPTLLMQSSPVRICALITVLASGAPRNCLMQWKHAPLLTMCAILLPDLLHPLCLEVWGVV